MKDRPEISLGILASEKMSQGCDRLLSQYKDRLEDEGVCRNSRRMVIITTQTAGFEVRKMALSDVKIILEREPLRERLKSVQQFRSMKLD